MTTLLNQDLLILYERYDGFARNHIANREGLSTSSDFPEDLWDAFGENGLQGLLLPVAYGGWGGQMLSLVRAGEALARGGNLGMVLSWMIHQLVSRYFIDTFGTDEQRQTYLPRLAAGKITACLAASEPGVGAHPKYLKTTAVSTPDGWRLTGEKTYITNAPIADLFIVIAITGTHAGRNRFTAFLIPRDEEGMSVSHPMELPFLKPAPHGWIRLDGCPAEAGQILGPKDRAYEEMVLRFRSIEDTGMQGVVLGGLSLVLEGYGKVLQEAVAAPTKDQKSELGAFKATLETMRIMAYESARMLDTGGEHPEFTPLLLQFRQMAKSFVQGVGELTAMHDLKLVPPIRQLIEDLLRSSDIAKNVAHIKQIRLGEAMLGR